jgi:hypothetical protein
MPIWARHLFGLAILLNAASGGEGQAGGGAPAAQPPAPAAQPAAPPAPAAPPVDREKLAAEARLAALKDLGFESEEAYKKHLDEKKKAEREKLSADEKRELALKEALDERGKVEAKAKEAEARAKALEAQIALRDKFDAEQIKPTERRIAEVLLEDEKAKRGRDFDETKFFAELRKERPYLFASGGAQPAAPAHTTTGGAPPPAQQQSSMFPGGLDASKLDEQQWRIWKTKNGLA